MYNSHIITNEESLTRIVFSHTDKYYIINATVWFKYTYNILKKEEEKNIKQTFQIGLNFLRYIKIILVRRPLCHRDSSSKIG